MVQSDAQRREIVHTTVYRYGLPVARSTHTFRLKPVQDYVQTVDHWELTVSPDGRRTEFDDVFDNNSVHMEIDTPYTELVIRSHAVVWVGTRPETGIAEMNRQQGRIPLFWMPRQRQMMLPYLLLPELPESQLIELTDYAMTFVDPNAYNLVDILERMNSAIHRDFQYVPGVTQLETTPYEVFRSRAGVCQDFSNLLICLARLLNIPARYRVGYVYTGGHYENKMQSDASHAWAELYLPGMGWRGYDPTNGCIIGHDHVQVACGRNYRDATPTSGTVHGGGIETICVEVRINEHTSGDTRAPNANGCGA